MKNVYTQIFQEMYFTNCKDGAKYGSRSSQVYLDYTWCYFWLQKVSRWSEFGGDDRLLLNILESISLWSNFYLYFLSLSHNMDVRLK